MLKTKRIIFNNLPFRFGEYEKSIILKEVVTKEESKTTINSRTVTHSLVELYAAAHKEIIGFVKANRVGNIKCLTAVSNFWSAKHGGDKYLGIRLYFVDANFRFCSILLGTRHFPPLYGGREQGIRVPFQIWIDGIFMDFGLTPGGSYGATTDSDPM
ncbi:hypothetical protein V7S43_016046 [Phytophthora oleae]|uniref:Uncharacterized protein n=1 Tax=Phytophthora oleae TaxID=2107226 RepID=A0ABD3EWJ5_9STRA